MPESFWQYRLDCFAPKGLNRLIHRFNYLLHFGCCVVLILALSFLLGTHAVFLGFSVLPILSWIFLLFALLSFSASARQTQPPTSAVLYSALSLIFLPSSL